MSSESANSLIARVETDRSMQISIDTLARGIDNYHIDVRLSRRFASDIKKLVSLLISQLAVPKTQDLG